jgi:hypothetical protein
MEKNGGFGELAREIQCGILEIAPRLSMLRHHTPAESLQPSSGIGEKDHFHAETRGTRRVFLEITERHGVALPRFQSLRWI